MTTDRGGYAAPQALPMRLGLNTAITQHGDVTAFAAARELPDNCVGVSAAMASLPCEKGVPLTSYIENIKVRKGDGQAEHARMKVVVMQTSFPDDAFTSHLTVVDPGRDGSKRHLNSIHAMGTSNAAIALGKKDCTGQALIISRKARRGYDPTNKQYPVTMKALRYGTHANEKFAKGNVGMTGRATITGDLVVFADERPGCQFPWAGLFVDLNGEEGPQSSEDFYELMQDSGGLTKATKEDLLADSKWAVVHKRGCLDSPADFCDDLLTDVHSALKRLAEETGQRYEDVLASDSVIYFFYDLREEVAEFERRQKLKHAGR